jgi:antibiotic biosynthesis monooxygenase (ABM) superfamily enzyme
MKFKMKLLAAVKIWIVIYPSITLFLYFLGGPLSAMPLYLRTLLLTAILVPWMMFVGLPLLEKITAAFSGIMSREKR